MRTKLIERGVTLAVAMGLASTLAGPSVAGAQATRDVAPVVEASRQVTSGPNPVRLFNIPALAVDPRNPDNVVMAVGDARNGGCGLRLSRDGGLSWATVAQNLLPKPTDYCIQRALGPVMAPAFGSGGKLHVAMPISSAKTDFANGPIGMVVANSPDLGVTHDLARVAKSDAVAFNPADYGASGPAQEGNQWHKFMSLDVDPNNPDRLYLIWRWLVWGFDLRQLQGDFVVRPYFSTSGDGGKTWTEPVDVLKVTQGEKAFGAGVPSIAVGPNGDVYAFARESPKPAPTGQPAPIPRLLMFKSTDQGKSWNTTVAFPGAARYGNPEAAIDRKTGRLYVAFEFRGAAAPSTSPANPSNIVLINSPDGGKTWTEPLTISDDPPDKRTNQYYPGISVAPNGRVDVAWHDYRNDPFYSPGQEGNMGTAVTERYWDVYYSYSTDNGATWAKNLRITDPSIDAKHGATFNNIDTRGPMGIASTNSAGYIAWSDARATVGENEAEDAYFSRVRFTPVAELGATGTSSGANKLSWGIAGAGMALGVGGLLLLLFLKTGRSAPAASRAATARSASPG